MTATTAPSHRTRWQKIARRIRVPMGFLFAIVYLWVARFSITAASLGYSLLLVAPGLLLRAYASGYVKKNSELTTTGPYAYTRNPLYLGSVMIAAGFGAASLNPWLLLSLVLLFLAIYLPVIQSEEQFLRSHFAEFDEYAARVPRLIPRIFPRGNPSVQPAQTAAATPAAHFSLALYRRHREYNALMGALGMYALLTLVLYLSH